MKKVIHYSVIVLFLLSCKNSAVSITQTGQQQLPEPYKITVDLDGTPVKEAPFLSDVVDSLEYIRLENNENYPVGFIVEELLPFITKDFIFIYCSHEAGLLQYTRDGRFVRKIGEYGRGPGEYIAVTACWVDEKNGMIYIVPVYKNVINKYNLHTGEFAGEIILKDPAGKEMKGTEISGIYAMPGEKVFGASRRSVLRDTVAYLYRELDLQAGIISPHRASHIYGLKNLGRNYGILGALSINYWYDSYNRVNFWEPLNDTSYVVHPDFTASPRVILDYGNKKLDLRSLLQESKIDPAKILWNRFWESPLFLFFEFVYQNKFYFFTFNKMNGDRAITQVLSKTEPIDKKIFFGLHNDIDGGFPSMGAYDKDMWFTFYSASQMINNLTPEHFGKVKSKVKYPDRMEKLQKLVSGLKEEDNPVIVIGHLKK